MKNYNTAAMEAPTQQDLKTQHQMALKAWALENIPDLTQQGWDELGQTYGNISMSCVLGGKREHNWTSKEGLISGLEMMP